MALLLGLILLLFSVHRAESLVCQWGYNVTIGNRCYKIEYENVALVAARDLQCLDCFAFLGIECTEEGKLGWEDATPLNYTHFWPGSDMKHCDPKTFESTDDYILTDKGYWRDFADGSSVGALICQQSGCGDFDEFNDGCFKVFAGSRMKWEEAEGHCKENGGHLGSLHDDKTSDFVRRSAVSLGVVEPIYIGLHRTESGVEWTDGSQVDYGNFASSTEGNCTVLHAEKVEGLWTWTGCDEERTFVCERKKTTGYHHNA